MLLQVRVSRVWVSLAEIKLMANSLSRCNIFIAILSSFQKFIQSKIIQSRVFERVFI